MNIVHVLDDNQLGGVTRLLSSLIGSLSDLGKHHQLLVKTQMRLAPDLARITKGGVLPDVIVVHFTMAWSKLAFLASLRRRAPEARIILVEHSYTEAFEHLFVAHRARFRHMLKLAYSMVDQVVSVSNGQARWLRDHHLVGSERLVVLPCVLDLSAFFAIPAVAANTTPMRLGAFGRFAPQKGFDTLISAMRDVPPALASLDIAGYGPDEASLRQAAKGMAHVRIHDRINPAAFLAAIDAVAMPSRFEAGAVSCWEVRAAGRPMIVSNVDGLPEQVPPALGLIVPPEDPAALAAAIRSLAQADRVTMGAMARRSTEGAYARVIAGWRDVLTSHTRGAAAANPIPALFGKSASCASAS